MEQIKEIKIFKELEKAIYTGYETNINKALAKIETEEGLKETINKEGKKYKGNIKQKLTNYLIRRHKAYLEQQINKLYSVENCDKKRFDYPLIITIDWLKSKMWGHNPKAKSNKGFIGSSVGGCGYDKQSTATAQALNDFEPLLYYLYDRKNEILKGTNFNENQNEINTSFLGYGLGYYILPKFEGGVGTNCFKKIIENLGLKWEEYTQAKSSDTFIVSKE